ncbi:MAG: hypothetical protein HY718_14640 [Planctomycetes bacterium]|nr:hypothetical protein [Planctomycetota bacterium]
MTRKITITYELPEEVCEALEWQASQEGRPVEALAAEYWLRHHPHKPRLSPEESGRRAADLESVFGSIDSGDENSSDNDRIDQDLVRAYEGRT